MLASATTTTITGLRLKWALLIGLVLNGQRVFQLAADGDQRIKLEGDVQLEIKPLRVPSFR